MISKRKVFAAVLLATIAMATIAYAQLLTGTVSVTTIEAVSVASSWDLGKIPARSAGSETKSCAINFTLTSNNGFTSGDKVLVAVELVVDDPNMYKGFKAFVVQITGPNYTSTVQALLTLNHPYAEFEITTADKLYMYDAKVIYSAGSKEVSSVTIHLGATVKAVY